MGLIKRDIRSLDYSLQVPRLLGGPRVMIDHSELL